MPQGNTKPNRRREFLSCPRAQVFLYPGEEEATARCCRTLFHRPLLPWEYAGLAGAPAHGRVSVGVIEGSLWLEIEELQSLGLIGVARICRRVGEPVLVKEGFHLLRSRRHRQGVGLQCFGKQVFSAMRLGIRKIETFGGRRGNENGYYTWPRFGFNCPLPRHLRRKLPTPLAHGKTVLDLMETPSGRLWWKTHGVPLPFVFDLDRSSRSLATLSRYWLHRNASLRPEEPGDRLAR